MDNISKRSNKKSKKQTAHTQIDKKTSRETDTRIYRQEDTHRQTDRQARIYMRIATDL